MKFISVVFHPLLTAPYMSVILALYLPEAYGAYPQDTVWRLVMAFVMLTALFPSLSILGLWLFTPWVTDLELSNRKERFVPFLVFIGCYIMAAKLLVFDLNLGLIVKVLMLSATLMVAIMVAINTKFKISIHSAAIWSIAGATLALAWKFPESDLLVVSTVLILGAGITGTSRLFLGYHRPSEVWIGAIYGFLFNALPILIFV